MATLLFAAVPGGLLAQSVGARQAASDPPEPPLQGIVVDELTGEVIRSARLTVLGTSIEARTDEAGTFSFTSLPPGAFSVRVEASGYPTVVDEVRVAEGEVVFLRLALPQVRFLLGEILVQGSPSERPNVSGGDARTAAELLALQVPGAYRPGSVVGRIEGAIVLRGVGSINLSNEPAVFLDGVRLGGDLGDAMDALSRIPAAHIRRIRVLRGPASAFAQGAANGAVYVETRNGPDEEP